MTSLLLVLINVVSLFIQHLKKHYIELKPFSSKLNLTSCKMQLTLTEIPSIICKLINLVKLPLDFIVLNENEIKNLQQH